MLERIRNAVVASLLVAFGCSSAFAEEREFRVGIISDKPVEKKLEEYAPLANYVAARLKKFGVTGGKVVVANDLKEMEQKIRNKEVDVIFESAFSTIQMREETGMRPRLLVWKHGIREYRTMFFVKKDSPITRLSQLKGKVIVLQDPRSTSAFLIPTVELKRAGLKVVPSNGKGKNSAVRYVLVGHEKNQAFWVIQKKADAAAFSSDDWESLTKREQSDLRVIHTTRPVLRYIASFHPALPAGLSDAVSDVLVGMDRDPEGQKVLALASRTKKIERLSAKDQKSLKYVKSIMQAR